MKPSKFSDIWSKICQRQNEPFQTKTKKDFTFKIVGNYLHAENQCDGRKEIPKENFEEAFGLMLKGLIKKPTDLPKSMWGYSYVYGIMMDPRICKSYWETNHNP